MLRSARPLGIVLAAAGLAVLLSFGAVAVQSVASFRAALVAHRQGQTNAMLDLRFLVASTQLALLVGGAAAGGLLALNGVTLILLGRLAQRVEGE